MYHSRKVDELSEIAKKVNPDRRLVDVMKIKKHLQLTINRKFNKAYSMLVQKLEYFTDHQFKIASKLERN
jgi:hypothetical protein